jgi:adenylate cyclase
VLGFAAVEAASRRRDARVLLLSLAFMATGGFMGLHALGTPGVLFTTDHSGFKVAIPVGLLVSAGFAAASAFVDLRPGFAPLVMRHRRSLRVTLLLTMGGWFVWTVANLPPLDGAKSEAARGTLLAVFAIVGTIVYAASAARYWTIFRSRPNLLSAAVIACFVLLSEALIGVAVTGERKWHASVNSGEAVLREIGGEGHVAYPMVGETINTGSRLEGLAPSAGC